MEMQHSGSQFSEEDFVRLQYDLTDIITSSSSESDVDFEFLYDEIEEENSIPPEEKDKRSDTQGIATPSSDENSVDDLDDNGEIWENLSSDEINDDLEIRILSGREKENEGICLVRWICIFICVWQTTCCISDTAVQWLLEFLSSFFSIIAKHCAFMASISSAFPSTLTLLRNFLELERDDFQKYVTCPKCNTLYSMEKAIQEGSRQVSKSCSYKKFPNHPQKARRKPCGELLMKEVRLQNGKVSLYPRKIYCYKSIIDTIRFFVEKKSGFQNECEKWREREIRKRPCRCY